MDLTQSIEPRSDQINADDLMSGPRTVTVADVRQGNDEQPVNVVTREFGPSRPYKPSKSMRRVMVAAWGPDSSTYAGRSMTIFRNPKIRFGKDEVGGIQISHLSHIDKPLTLALTVTRGKRAPFKVQPLAEAAPEPERMTREQSQELVAALNEAGLTEKDDMRARCAVIVERDLTSAGDLTSDEAAHVIAELGKRTESAAPEDVDEEELPVDAEGGEQQ